MGQVRQPSREIVSEYQSTTARLPSFQPTRVDFLENRRAAHASCTSSLDDAECERSIMFKVVRLNHSSFSEIRPDTSESQEFNDAG